MGEFSPRGDHEKIERAEVSKKFCDYVDDKFKLYPGYVEVDNTWPTNTYRSISFRSSQPDKCGEITTAEVLAVDIFDSIGNKADNNPSRTARQIRIETIANRIDGTPVVIARQDYTVKGSGEYLRRTDWSIPVGSKSTDLAPIETIEETHDGLDEALRRVSLLGVIEPPAPHKQ